MVYTILIKYILLGVLKPLNDVINGHTYFIPTVHVRINFCTIKNMYMLN